MPCCCPTHLSRRRFLAGTATLPLAGAVSGCDSAAALVSEEEAAEMGRAAWAEIRSEVPESRDARFSGVVAELSERLIRAAGGQPSDWEVVAFESAEINAFALPGNRIGVFRGIYDLAGNASELAAVIGHEIGHLEADHARKRMGSARAQGILERIAAIFLQSAEIEFGAEIMAALGVGLRYGLALPYSRGQELEADRLGLALVGQAGLDPAAAIPFWERMAEAQAGRPPEFLATHPAPASRIREIREMLPEIRES
ncbi:M48 family metallopeptidase [Roseivivax sp. CAU 1761]